MKKILFIWVSILFLIHNKSNAQVNQPSEKQYVLLVSFDGFRYDYPDKFDLKNFKKLKEKSSYANNGMIPSFPSKTFPNHYTIITGMYPGNHGLVDNLFYSPAEDKIYSIPDREAVQNPNFYGGIPLWQWLQKHKIKTASYFWVGSEAPIQGEYPTYWKPFDEKVPYSERVEQVMNWFRLPESERPQFVTLYFEFIDHAGHHTGTNSEKLKQELQKADQILGQITEGVESLNIPITTIITADHGMIDMTSEKGKIIFTEKIENQLKSKADIINNGMHCQVYLKDKSQKEEVYQELKKYFAEMNHVKVYKKQKTPKKWHYRNHENIGDLLIITDAPYYMVKDENNFWAGKTGIWGTHGYDPYTTPEMKAIFYAFGNKIKENNPIKSFENIHIYPLINKILGVENPKNIDGKTRVLSSIIKK